MAVARVRLVRVVPQQRAVVRLLDDLGLRRRRLALQVRGRQGQDFVVRRCWSGHFSFLCGYPFGLSFFLSFFLSLSLFSSFASLSYRLGKGGRRGLSIVGKGRAILAGFLFGF